ncbi:putative hydrolase of the alpha/beta superfamily [Archaeoglobus sulfaticallidus PM70-1]|uniref:Putative hydrolase of the alpha/beta superfamily n=1 Tax=Archaeoglobus sulfaticallidus PM70-1 TaxID=387631 RepID=N0BCB5_9EURY|nr:hydrolase of the alpha/beta superfamily [Archaeoglobus sulfaticallidus]AGK61259.1 putative hydrolase of the alpha/beta superfamily [Archaeoglobus sulfaticallidus PM70-1]
METVINGIACTYNIFGEKAVLLCPPHPEMGGSRFDVRIMRISEELNDAGITTLAFDYRKPFRDGVGEVEDAIACLRFLRERFESVAVVGYSFGSVVASNLLEANSLVLISPLRKINSIGLKNSETPKLVIVAKHDQIIPYEESVEIASWLNPPRRVVEVETDHFYTGKYDFLARTVREFLE